MDYVEDLRSLEDGDKRASDVLEAIFGDVQRRLDRAESVAASATEVREQLVAQGEAILAEATGPILARLRAAADIGVIFTAASVTEVAIGLGARTFVVAEADRGAFAPAAMLTAVTPDAPDVALFGRKVSYDRATGQLVINVTSAQGAGTYASWTITAGSRVAGASQVAVTPPTGFAGETAQVLFAELAAALGGRADFAEEIDAAVADRHTRSEVAALLNAKAARTAALIALGALAPGADKLPLFTSESGATALQLSATVRALIGAADGPAARGAIGAASPSEIAAAVAALVGSTPAVLDTLGELAAALGGDPNFATTVTTAIAGKQPQNETLTALAALALAGDRLPYATGAHGFATTAFSAFARTLVGAADASTARLALGASAIFDELRTPNALIPRMRPTAPARSALGGALAGNGKWQGGVMGADGKIYGAPYNAADVLIIDPAAQTATRNGFSLGLAGSSQWYGGALGPDGKIYFAPYDAPNVLVLDTIAGVASLTTFGLNLAAAGKYAGAVLGGDGKIYCIPNSATDVLIIDPATGTATLSAMATSLTGVAKWIGGVMAADGKIYAIPHHATDILVIDPSAGTAARSALGASLTGAAKWSGGALGVDGKVYGIPRDAADILIIDPVFGIASRSALGANLVDSGKWASGALGPDGVIYAAPYGAADVLAINTRLGTASRASYGLTLSDVTKWVGATLGTDGRIYGVPRNAADVLMIGKFIANFRTAALMGAHLNTL